MRLVWYSLIVRSPCRSWLPLFSFIRIYVLILYCLKPLQFNNLVGNFVQGFILGDHQRLICTPLLLKVCTICSLQSQGTTVFCHPSSEATVVAEDSAPAFPVLCCSSTGPGHLVFSFFSPSLDISSLLNLFVLLLPH